MAIDPNSRYDISSTKANLEFSKDIAKDKLLTGPKYKMSKVDPEYGPAENSSHARYLTDRTPLELNIEDINMFKYDMDRCIKCKGCYWVEHTYNPGVRFNTRCPSNLWNDFDAYGAMGKMRIGVGMVEGKLDWSPKLLEVIYADAEDGAADVACKRNLDLEIGLSLKSLRVKACQDGQAPLPAHKAVIDNVLATGNAFGLTTDRAAWAAGLNLPESADVVYYVGDNNSYTSPEIAKATATILEKCGVKFALLKGEKNTGTDAFSAGDIPTARKLAQEALDQVKASGAKTLVVSDGEVYRAWKVEVPMCLNIATADLGFEVKHILEIAADAIEAGTLVLTKPIDSRIAYHDCCSVSRTCDDWTPYKGERGWMGMVYPGLRRRRGRQGLYEAPRKILAAIPGADVTEFIRIRENTFCCSALGGVKYNFPELAQFAANHRIDEAKECGIETIVTGAAACRDNFNAVLRDNEDDSVKAMDITELIVAAL